MKSVWMFLCHVANRQTYRQTDKQRQKHNLLGGGNQLIRSYGLMTLYLSVYRQHQQSSGGWRKDEARALDGASALYFL